MLPVTRVDRARDALGAHTHADGAPFAPRNAVERGMYAMYDAGRMHGLPVGVQVVGARLEEEKVLAGMRVIEKALADAGRGFVAKQLP